MGLALGSDLLSRSIANLVKMGKDDNREDKLGELLLLREIKSNAKSLFLHFISMRL